MFNLQRKENERGRLSVNDGMRIRVVIFRTMVTICISSHKNVSTVCTRQKYHKM